MIISFFSSRESKIYEKHLMDTLWKFGKGLYASGVRILNDRQRETLIPKLFRSLAGARRGTTRVRKPVPSLVNAVMSLQVP